MAQIATASPNKGDNKRRAVYHKVCLLGDGSVSLHFMQIDNVREREPYVFYLRRIINERSESKLTEHGFCLTVNLVLHKNTDEPLRNVRGYQMLGYCTSSDGEPLTIKAVTQRMRVLIKVSPMYFTYCVYITQANSSFQFLNSHPENKFDRHIYNGQLFLQTKNGAQPATDFITVDSAVKLLKLLYLDPHEDSFPHRWGTTNIDVVRTWIDTKKLTPAHKSELQIESEELDETQKVPAVETVGTSDDDSDGLFDEDNLCNDEQDDVNRTRKPTKGDGSVSTKTKAKRDYKHDDDYEI